MADTFDLAHGAPGSRRSRPAGLTTRADYDYRLLQPRETTDANGNYQFTGLSAGTYTVQEVLLGGVLLSAPASCENQSFS